MADSYLKFSEIQSIDAFKSYCSSRGGCWMVALVQDADCGSGLFVAPGMSGDEYKFNFSSNFRACAICLQPYFVVENVIAKNMNVFAFARSCHFCRLGDSDFSLLKRYFKSLRELESEEPTMLAYEARYHVCHALMDTVSLVLYHGLVRNTTRSADIAFRFMKLVRANCTKERKMDFYAGSFNLSTKYLSTLISSETGLPVSKWIELFAVSEAKRQLRNNSFSVNQVSTALNFRSTSDFSKYFRKSTGMSPNEYRRLLLA